VHVSFIDYVSLIWQISPWEPLRPTTTTLTARSFVQTTTVYVHSMIQRLRASRTIVDSLRVAIARFCNHSVHKSKLAFM
jgi:hypothetical protein